MDSMPRDLEVNLSSTLSAGNLSAKVPPLVLPSLPMDGFPETEEIDIDLEDACPEFSLVERGLNGLGKGNSPISLILPSFASQVEEKTRILMYKFQNAPGFVG